MAFTQKDMSGSLFKNDRKGHESQPSAKGTAMIGGVEYWVSAWTKKDKNGNPWQSLAFTVKEGKPITTPAADKKAANKKLDEDIPF
jgi:hypothetical protein